MYIYPTFPPCSWIELSNRFESLNSLFKIRERKFHTYKNKVFSNFTQSFFSLDFGSYVLGILRCVEFNFFEAFQNGFLQKSGKGLKYLVF